MAPSQQFDADRCRLSDPWTRCFITSEVAGVISALAGVASWKAALCGVLGGVAQLVERHVRNVEVGGSSPLTSTLWLVHQSFELGLTN